MLTISCVKLEKDKTNKTKDLFNTAYFIEKEIRQGEQLKPMILNATNSRTMKNLTGSAFIDDWNNITVTIYVDNSVRFGRDTVEGLRISAEKPQITKPSINRKSEEWSRAVEAYVRDGDFAEIEKHRTLSGDDKSEIKRLAKQ